MKAVEVTAERAMTFDEVERGETFLDGRGDLFMKMTPTCDAEDADNAVNLKAGYACMFDGNEEVEAVDARVVIFSR